jgi:hypothetical protein
MSIGNLKTEGGKGTNFPWQYRMLKGLQGIIDVINSTANGSEYEAQLVNITCPDPIAPPAPHAGTKLYLEVRTWDTVTGGFTNINYYLPGSNTAYPAVDFAACTVIYLQSGDATEATLAAILAKNTEIETTANAIETSNAAILADTAAIDTATAAINTNTATLGVTTNTAFMVRGTGSVTVTDSVKSISVYNAHASATGTITIGLGSAANLLAGETVNFDAGGNGNKFPASHFVVNGGGTADMLIIYTY